MNYSTLIITFIYHYTLYRSMYGSDYVPYELIGFGVFWFTVLVITVVTILVLYSLWIRLVESVRDKIWEDHNPSAGEQPEGVRLAIAFLVHVVWSVSKFRSPICWRWKTYKKNYVN